MAGLKKWEDDRRPHRAQIENYRNCVNRALNRMMEDGRTDVFIVEAFGRLFQMEGISKKVRNRFSRWVRGLIDERLAFKAAVHQVRVAKVPAAYSWIGKTAMVIVSSVCIAAQSIRRIRWGPSTC